MGIGIMHNFCYFPYTFFYFYKLYFSKIAVTSLFIRSFLLISQCLSGKESACNAGDAGSISGLGRFPEEESGNPLKYSCQGNPMSRGAWWAMVYGVAKSWTRLSG